MHKNETMSVSLMSRRFADKVGGIAVSAGSWVYPPYYRIQCERLKNRTSEVRQREERIVGGLGEIMIGYVRGYLEIDHEELICVVEAIRPSLHEVVGYDAVFDPHTASILEKVAPLAKTDLPITSPSPYQI